PRAPFLDPPASAARPANAAGHGGVGGRPFPNPPGSGAAGEAGESAQRHDAAAPPPLPAGARQQAPAPLADARPTPRAARQYRRGAEAASSVGPGGEAALRPVSGDRIEPEQHMAFLRNRMFWQTLLCPAAVPLDASVDPERLLDLAVATSSRPEAADPDVRS